MSVCLLCGSPVWPSPPVVGPLRGPPLCVGPQTLVVCVLCGSPVWPSPPVVGPLRAPPLCVGPLWVGPSGPPLPCSRFPWHLFLVLPLACAHALVVSEPTTTLLLVQLVARCEAPPPTTATSSRNEPRLILSSCGAVVAPLLVLSSCVCVVVSCVVLCCSCFVYTCVTSFSSSCRVAPPNATSSRNSPQLRVNPSPCSARRALRSAPSNDAITKRTSTSILLSCRVVPPNATSSRNSPERFSLFFSLFSSSHCEAPLQLPQPRPETNFK